MNEEIYIAEDEDGIRLTVKTFLESEGYAVSDFPNGDLLYDAFLDKQPDLLILDEPTSVLTPQAVERLFVTLRKLSAEGCSILYISHKLDEIRALCHHCTVLRGGRVTGEVDPTTQSNAELSRLMIGA